MTLLFNVFPKFPFNVKFSLQVTFEVQRRDVAQERRFLVVIFVLGGNLDIVQFGEQLLLSSFVVELH